jgi:transitional endoplasmic reticulum ATPase
MAEQPECVRLVVGDATLDDVAESNARLSTKVLERLRIREGDPVRVIGRHEIVATALAAGPEDEGLDIIRLDGTQRRALGIEPGDPVDVIPLQLKDAERVELVAVGDAARTDLSLEDVRADLAGRAIVVGQTIMTAPTKKTFDAEVSLLGLPVADVHGTSSDLDGVLLRVVATTPEGIVRIADNTVIELRPLDADEDHAEHGHAADPPPTP